jgi:hypothetical protein
MTLCGALYAWIDTDKDNVEVGCEVIGDLVEMVVMCAFG